jgi:O-antigen/teichoic acid export membrane protein/peptidoglycan/xylan/chitin deacetylase (PgdA/CDA1 family)
MSYMSEPQKKQSANPEKGRKSTEDMTGKDRLIGNVIFSWASHFVFIIAGFLIPRIIDQHLGQELLGVWDFGWSLVSYFSLVQAGIGSSVNRYVARYRAAGDITGVNRIVSSVFCVMIIAGMLVLGLTIVVSLLLPQLFGIKLGENVRAAQWVLFFLGAGLAVEISFSAFSGVLTGCHRWILHNFIKSGWHIVTVIGIILSLVQGGGLPSLAIIVFAGLVLACATRVVMAYQVCKGLRIRLSLVGWETIRELFVFGGKTLIPSVSNLLVNQTTCVLIVAYIGPAALALYARPRSLILHINTLISKMSMVLTPTASSLQGMGKMEEIRELLIKSVRYSLYMALPMVLVLVVFGGQVLRVWMGPQYANGLIPAILAAGYLSTIAQLPVLNILAGLNAHGRAGIAQLVASLCSVGLMVLLLGFLGRGLSGAAVAVTLPLTIINIIYLPYVICRQTKLDIKKYVLSVVIDPVVHVLPFALCLLAARYVFKTEPLFGLIWGGIVGGAILTFIYWRQVLPERLRERSMNYLPGCIVHGSNCLRQCILQAMRWTGFIRICQYIHRNRIVILAIHGVMDTKDNPAWNPLRPQLSRDKLEQYLRVLSKRYHFISLADAVEMLQGRSPIIPNCLVFTFDDGYRNNLTHALPILRRYNAPATFFISTGFLDNPRPFWWDRLDYALQYASVHNREVKIGSVSVCIDNSCKETLEMSYQQLRRSAKKQQMSDLEFLQEIEQLAFQLENESGRSLAKIQEEDDWSAIMLWEQIINSGNGDVAFGSHTVDHMRLGLVEADNAKYQLVRSKQDIEAHTKKPCWSICFPNGSYNDKTIALAIESDYICGVTCDEGFNCIHEDVMKLRRINLPISVSSNDLLFRLSVGRSGIIP